jgi:hypothetical protein
MPLSRAINYTHPTATDFFENLIIAEEPIPILTVDLAEQVIKRWLDRRMLAITVTVNAGGKKTLQTKAAPHTRSRPTFCTGARFTLKMQRNRVAGRSSEGRSIH